MNLLIKLNPVELSLSIFFLTFYPDFYIRQSGILVKQIYKYFYQMAKREVDTFKEF